MNLQDLEILEDEFDLFVALNNQEKIEFLFDAIEIGLEASVLKQLEKLDSIPAPNSKYKLSSADFEIGNTRLSVTNSQNQVHLNSNSLKAIKSFVAKMTNDGLILCPLDKKKSVFDMYRFFKAYKLVGRTGPISSN